jgi:single-strand DNA-binding protein
MVKGQQMYVSGRQTTRKYDDAKGVTKYSTEVIADRMQMLAKPQGQQAEARPVQVAKVSSRIEDIDSDIPF